MADVRLPMDEAVECLTRACDLDAIVKPRFDDPVMDALSVAVDVGTVRASDPAVETGLSPEDAVIAASGLMAWRQHLSGRWWRGLTGPLLVRTSAGPATVIPGRRGLRLVESLTRRTQSVDRHSAKDISGPALSFARTLPPESRWWKLLLWSLTRRDRIDVWVLVLLGLLGGLAGLLLPLATREIFETAVPAGDARRAVIVLAVFAVGSVGAAFLAVARGLLVVRMRDRSDMVLAPAVMAHLLRLRVGFFRTRSTGDVLNRALSVDAARQQVDDSALATLVTAVFGLVNLGFLLVADVKVGLVSLAAVVLSIGASIFFQLRARVRLPRLLEARSRSDATLLSLVDSLVAWRVAGAEDRALARWATDQGESTTALRQRLRAISVTEPVDVAGPLVVTVVFVIAVMLVPGGRLQPGSTTAPGVFLALYAAAAQLAVAMMALSSQLVALSELGPALDRLRPVVVEQRERTAPSMPPGRLSGAVALSDVVFGYRPDRPPLFDRFSLSVEPGEFIAVVGPSGGGKSTVLRLLLGFEEPWEGMVSYDGRDLAGLDPTAVRRQLGVVLQASRPLGTTVRECVTGPRIIDDDEVWELLERSGFSDDVRQMSGGLHASVGQHGMSLSGGQRQRLMIAAALAVRPRIMLLDEATSALDNITQRVVMRTILSSQVTRVVVAHRMSTIRDADRVIVVAGGCIAEQGRPDELLAAGGHFARLAKRQQA